MPASHIHTSPMYLVFREAHGATHFIPWADLTTAGVPVDPETGTNMALIGWSTSIN